MKLNKHRFSFFAALVLVTSLLTGINSFASPLPFPDTPAWCAAAIEEMAENHILSGYADGLFHPDAAMTRAQMAKVLHLIYVPEIDETYYATDPYGQNSQRFWEAAEAANPGNWANLYIAACNELGTTEFGYDYQVWAQPATRIEMAEMALHYASARINLDCTEPVLYVAEGIENYIADYNEFKNHPYADAVLWMYTEGYVNGSDSAGTFHANTALTRAQACAILYRIQNEDARVSVYGTIETPSSFQGGAYTPGSVYGPKLNQAELDAVKKVVEEFVNSYISTDMSDYEKVSTAQAFLNETCSFASTWEKNQANTAWGALVYHEAQCSGYARAMKALCDGMGIGCHYVHANESSSNSSHQFNMVQVDGTWYIVDAQLNDSSGFPAAFLISGQAYTRMTGVTWDQAGLPDCPKNYQ